MESYNYLVSKRAFYRVIFKKVVRSHCSDLPGRSLYLPWYSHCLGWPRAKSGHIKVYRTVRSETTPSCVFITGH